MQIEKYFIAMKKENIKLDLFLEKLKQRNFIVGDFL